MDILSARFSQILKVSLWVMDVAPAVVLKTFLTSIDLLIGDVIHVWSLEMQSVSL